MFSDSFPAAARTAGVSASRVVLSCSVGATGALGDCQVKDENPAGLGFGPAALTLAPHFVMKEWSDAGLAMVGRKINLPVSYKMEVKDVPAPEKAAASQPASGAPAQQ
jgi:hypothetical protein